MGWQSDRFVGSSRVGLLTTGRKVPGLPGGPPTEWPYMSSHWPDALAEATLEGTDLVVGALWIGTVLLVCVDAIVEASVCAHWACAFWKDAEAPAARAYLIFGFDPRVWPTISAGSVMSEWASVKQKHSNSETVPGGQGAPPWWLSVVDLLAQRLTDLGRPIVYLVQQIFTECACHVQRAE